MSEKDEHRKQVEIGKVKPPRYKLSVDDYIYCHSCGHIDICENFPFMDLPDEPIREKYCPNCMQDDMINLSNVPHCKDCPDFVGINQCRDCPNPRNYTRKLFKNP